MYAAFLKLDKGSDRNSAKEPIKGMSPERELNPRPIVYKTIALPLSYRGMNHYCVVCL